MAGAYWLTFENLAVAACIGVTSFVQRLCHFAPLAFSELDSLRARPRSLGTRGRIEKKKKPHQHDWAEKSNVSTSLLAREHRLFQRQNKIINECEMLHNSD